MRATSTEDSGFCREIVQNKACQLAMTRCDIEACHQGSVPIRRNPNANPNPNP